MARGRVDPPNLDDRSWQDIVDQARALIPTYAPEWTDHNPSDLGMALIELFAWLVEGLTYRLNRVPDKNLIEFLNLIGVTRDPATPAATYVTYRSAPGMGPLWVPRGSQAATPQTDSEEAIVFETDQEVTILPLNLTAALYLDKDKDNNTVYKDGTANLVGAPLSGLTLTLPAGETDLPILALGFDAASTERLRLLLRFSQPVGGAASLAAAAGRESPSETPQITWLYSSAAKGWQPLPAGNVEDGTDGLRRNGPVSLTIPTDWAAQTAMAWETKPDEAAGDAVKTPRFWVGLRLAAGKDAESVELGFEHILFNSVPATNALTVKEERLGISNGQPFQFFALHQRPLFKQVGARDPYGHLQLQVREPMVGGGFGEWRDWARVDDFPAGPGAYFRLNPVTGEINFGNYAATTAPDGHGAIPPQGSEIRAAAYRYVAGDARGNVPAKAINVMRTPLAGLVDVMNLVRASGGADEEDAAETKRRGPEILRNRNRAITVDDYEYLAREASTMIKKVRCLPPRLHTTSDGSGSPNMPWRYGGLNRDVSQVNVIIIPAAPIQDRKPAASPIPSAELLQEVTAYLAQRRSMTSALTVTGPRYVPIRVHLTMYVWQQAINAGKISEDMTTVRQDLDQKIRQFLHPIVGGPNGAGWEIGQDLTIAGLFEFLQPEADVGFIERLELETLPPLYPGSRPPGFLSDDKKRVWVQLADYEMICSAPDGKDGHQIDVKAI